jgi:hypothetical protein
MHKGHSIITLGVCFDQAGRILARMPLAPAAANASNPRAAFADDDAEPLSSTAVCPLFTPAPVWVPSGGVDEDGVASSRPDIMSRARTATHTASTSHTLPCGERQSSKSFERSPAAEMQKLHGFAI